MVSSIDNYQPQIICNVVDASSTITRRRRRPSSSSSSNTTTSLSIFSKIAKITAASYALLFCTSHQDVLAHSSETRVIESHNLLETLELEQTKRNIQSSFRANQEEEVQHDNKFIQLNIPTRFLRDNHQYSSDNAKRRVQRRGDDTIAQAAPGSNNNNNNAYDAYGVPPSSNTASETNDNNDANNGSTGWFGKKQSPDNTAAANTNDAAGGNSAYGSYSGNSNSASSGGAYGSYGSAAGSTGSNSGYGSYGASPSSSTYGASSTSAYGASSTSAYGASPSSSTYGASPRSSSSYGGSSYSSTWGTGSASSTSKWGSNTSNNLRGGGNGPPVKIGLFKAIFFLLLICTTGMLLTAHSLEHHPEGTFANCCRVSLHTVNCVYRVMFNLYHCRLGELPGIICGGSELEEDEYTEEELERMTLRPGIERALDTEHRKALRKVGVEMNMIKPKNGSGKSKGVQNGASISR